MLSAGRYGRVREEGITMNPVRATLSLLTVGVASLALIACDSAAADNDDPTEVPPVATSPSTPTPGGDTPVTPGDPPATGTPAEEPPYETEEVLAPIESVDVIVRESFPPQYVAVVTSGLPSGCAAFHSIEVERDGDTFSVTVLNTMPAPGQDIACTMIYGYIENSVQLEGEFVSGTEYTVVVNSDTEMTFVAQ